MFKYLLNKFAFVIKKFIFSALIIYAYNIVVYPTFNIIPINIFTIFLIMVLGFPGIIGISLFYIFVM